MTSPCQALPFQISVARCARLMPTAMHSDVLRQEIPDNPVATGGRLNGCSTLPAAATVRCAACSVPRRLGDAAADDGDPAGQNARAPAAKAARLRPVRRIPIA